MKLRELMYFIEKRPQMYILELKIENLHHFLNGYNVSNHLNYIDDDTNEIFHDKFHDWSKKQIEKKYNIVLEEHRNYLYYIQQIDATEEEKVWIFFKLAQKFFDEMEEEGIISSL